ncbi:MAG: hypothetical protein ACJA2M_001709 [Polaribacter sp.]|jgi:hypothetical protein
MIKIQLHFLQNLNNDSYKFWQNIALNELPKLHSIFEYTQDMFEQIPNDEINRFNDFSFSIGNYYIKTIMDKNETVGEIDYIIELAHNLN